MSGRSVVVIGGGVIGVSSAYYLARDGWEVTLLEKGEICAGSSYGNAGLIVPSHLVPLAAPGVWWQGVKWMLNSESPFYIKPRASLELARWLWRFRAACTPGRVRRAMPLLRRLSVESLELYRGFAEKDARLRLPPVGLDDGVLHARGPGPRPRGGQAPPRGRRDRRGPGRRRRRGRPSPCCGPGVVGALYCREDALLVPDRFVKGLAKLAESVGVRVMTGTEAIGFRTQRRPRHRRSRRRAGRSPPTRSSWRRARGRRTWAAPSGSACRSSRPRATASRTGARRGRRRSRSCPPRAASRSRRWASSSGSAGRSSSPAWTSRSTAAAWRPSAGRRSPCIEGGESLELLEIWRGLRPCTPDGLPLVGRPRRFDNLVMAAGHAMVGMSLGPGDRQARRPARRRRDAAGRRPPARSRPLLRSGPRPRRVDRGARLAL